MRKSDSGGEIMGDEAAAAFQPAVNNSPFASREQRLRFHVDLSSDRAVSWRKLLKSLPQPPSFQAPPGANPALEARLAPESALTSKGPSSATNRFSNVIEKIERLYKGQDSDEEILDVVPDDDQYNTDDSFIDDRELDEYFSVDGIKTKHSGFYINKGKLENTDEHPSPPPPVLQKKRRRDGSHQHLLKRSKGGSSSFDLNVGHCLVNKQAETQPQSSLSRSRDDPSCNHRNSPLKVNRYARGAGHGQELGRHDVLQDRKHTIAIAGESKSLEPYKFWDKAPPSGAPHSSEDSPIKRASGFKAPQLKRAMLDLKLGVAALCPSNPETSDQERALTGGRTKRLPKEIRQKLAKVARLAARQGKIPDEFVDRLMSILGHLMQLKTLKRNLREMVEMELVAKQEKEGRFLHKKREIAELVQSRVSTMREKAVDNSWDDFQATPGSAKKAHVYKWDQGTEDLVCDLYDLYLEGSDENKGSQSRKLYAELAEIWPEGWMDKDGIKSAVYRAKDRKKALYKMAANEAKKKLPDLNERAIKCSLTASSQPAQLPIARKDPEHHVAAGPKVDSSNGNKVKEEPGTDGPVVLLKFRKQKSGSESDEGFRRNLLPQLQRGAVVNEKQEL